MPSTHISQRYDIGQHVEVPSYDTYAMATITHIFINTDMVISKDGIVEDTHISYAVFYPQYDRTIRVDHKDILPVPNVAQA